jgi:hypothetical protein
MVDRTDIDALLIGALYGELTPADEARLAAHLESHPADRTALNDLTRTRAAVRDSRILAFQFDPPQAISALLLQEASRRAPRAVTDRGEGATWFQRFVRSFMAHPAMAAAATLVLVISVAGGLYLRGTDQMARPEASSVVFDRAPAPSLATGAGAPSSPAPAAEAPAAAAAPGGAAGSGAYRARLDGASAGHGDTAVAKGELAQPRAPAPSDPSKLQDDLGGRASYEETNAGGLAAVRDAERRKLEAVTKAAPAKTARAQAVRGIELRTPQPQPKDLPDIDDEKPAAGRREAAGDRRTANEVAAADRRNAAPGGGAPATPPASVPPPPPAAAPAPRPAGPAGTADFDAPAQTSAQASAKEAKRPAAKPSANQLPPSSAANAQNAQADRRLDKTANSLDGDAKQAPADPTLLEWARKQREQVIAYVNANRCREAAGAAVEIYNRAPDYYNANVATDRQIKPCLAYVTTERDRADRKRASKNAADVQAPAQAAPTRK